MVSRPEIFVLLRPSLYRQLFAAQSDQTLRELGAVVWHGEERDLTSAELAERIPGFDVIITGWGTPTFTDQVLATADRLQLIAHSAGSLKHMLPPAVFERGLSVTHAASAIAPPVAEMTILLILLCLRQVHEYDRLLKAGESWESAKTLGMGQELAGQRVGVVGAGYTGRHVIELLRALKAEVWVYDPYLDRQRAAGLGVQQVALDDLLAGCPIITLQAPVTAETRHMIGARELDLIQDGAIFVNTARSRLVDQEALLAALQSGRFQAALDVFDDEPLPVEHPFRRLDNVVITPHVAGLSRQARLRQGQTVTEEIKRFLAGETLRYQVTRDMLNNMA